MSALHRFEQRLELLVTGAFARAFRSAVQPMEIAAALQREVDNSAQILSRDRRLAPNDFVIDLSPTDFDRLSAYGETLSGELAHMLHEHADEQGYLFAGALQLTFQRADDLTTGRFRVRSSAAADVTPGPGRSGTAAAPVAEPPVGRTPVQQPYVPPPPAPRPAVAEPEAVQPQVARIPEPDPAVREAVVTLEVHGTRHPLEPPGAVLGRGSQSDLRIDDPGVSRRHAEVRLQRTADGILVTVVDLGSTNGTLVDGRRVQHAILADGSVITVGGTALTVHVADESRPARPVGGPAGSTGGMGGPAVHGGW